MRFVRPGSVSGTLDAPPSKSMMQRAVIAAALAEGETRISNPSFCDDSLAALGAIRAFGAEFERGEDAVTINGAPASGGGVLDCGESGTCMRIITPVAAALGGSYTITGRGTLMKRPMGMLEGPLRQLGAQVRTQGGMPPISVKGPMRGGSVRVDGSESSQHVSGLMMALPLCEGDSVLDIFSLKSRDYAGLTSETLVRFGIRMGRDFSPRPLERLDRFLIKGGQAYRPCAFRVDGDWSGAAFMLVAGAIAGKAEVRGLGFGQADSAIMYALQDAGAEVSEECGTASAGKASLRAFEFDASDCPDLFPPLAVLACSCEGKSVIRGASRLKHKESDRAAALCGELGKLGADIKVIGDRMEISGKRLRGGRMDSRGDHRIAMAGAVAALRSESGVEIEGDECVSKSYPRFFDDLESLRDG